MDSSIDDINVRQMFVESEIEWAAFRDIASLNAEFPLFTTDSLNTIECE